MEDQLRACVNGPLAEHADGFRAELLSQGYTRDAVSCQLRLMAGVSGWLSVSGMEPSELASTALMDEFLKARRAEGCKRLLSRRAMMPLIAYLARVNVAPAALVVTGSPTDVLIEEYRRYLVDERGLSKSTVAWYLDAARLFLSECGHLDDGADLRQMTAEQVTGFVVEQCHRRRIGAAKVLVTRLGRCSGSCSSLVPPLTSWQGW